MPKYFIKGPVVLNGEMHEGTVKEPKEVSLDSDLFVITEPRYMGLPGAEQYIKASAEEPATIRIPEGSFIDNGLRPVGDQRAKLKPHYVEGKHGAKKTAVEQFGQIEVMAGPVENISTKDNDDTRPERQAAKRGDFMTASVSPTTGAVGTTDKKEAAASTKKSEGLPQSQGGHLATDDTEPHGKHHKKGDKTPL